MIIVLAGVPSAYYFGHEGLHNVLVIDLLGPSLEDLFDICSRKLTIKTVAMVAKQMVFSYFITTTKNILKLNYYMYIRYLVYKVFMNVI